MATRCLIFKKILDHLRSSKVSLRANEALGLESSLVSTWRRFPAQRSAKNDAQPMIKKYISNMIKKWKSCELALQNLQILSRKNRKKL